jgi:hypothetical protein
MLVDVSLAGNVALSPLCISGILPLSQLRGLTLPDFLEFAGDWSLLVNHDKGLSISFKESTAGDGCVLG